MNRIVLLAAVSWAVLVGCAPAAPDSLLEEDASLRRPRPQPHPQTSSGVLGYVGCSMTMAGRDGYVQAGGTKTIWPLVNYGGGSPQKWAQDLSSQSTWWSSFDSALRQYPTTQLIWWELCALSGDASDLTAAQVVLQELHRRAPGAAIVVSAQPSYDPSNHACSIAGADGPARMQALVEAVLALADPLVSRGPRLAALAFPAETKTDGCHPNTAGTLSTGQQLVAFFDSAQVDAGIVVDAGTTPRDAGTSPSQARGIYVVDDGDTDFATALAQPFVDGALVRVGWSTIERTEGTYNFTTLCSKVTTAHTAGKKVSLANFAVAPSWLMSQVSPTEQWTHPQYGAQPMPWNTLGLQKLQAFAEAEANFVCGGYKLKEHPAILQVDTPILGMQSIRNAPSAPLTQLTDAVKASVNLWYAAYGAGHNFYVGLFPLGSSAADAIAIRDAVRAEHPAHHWFQETWTGNGPSGTLATALDPNATTRSFNVMLQACGYWSNQSRIKCSFANTDSPQVGYDSVATDFQAKYLEIYPDDLNFASYASMLQTIHARIWQ